MGKSAIQGSNFDWDALWKAFKETDKRFKDTDEKFKKTDKEIKAIARKIDKLAESTKRLDRYVSNQSKTLEEYFFESLSDKINTDGEIKINGYSFEYISLNDYIGVKKRRREVDIVLLAPVDDVILIVEVKQRINPNDIEKLKEIVPFLRKDRRYKNIKKILLGFATTSASNNIKQKILDEGMILFTTPNNLKVDYKTLKNF